MNTKRLFLLLFVTLVCVMTSYPYETGKFTMLGKDCTIYFDDIRNENYYYRGMYQDACLDRIPKTAFDRMVERGKDNYFQGQINRGKISKKKINGIYKAFENLRANSGLGFSDDSLSDFERSMAKEMWSHFLGRFLISDIPENIETIETNMFSNKFSILFYIIGDNLYDQAFIIVNPEHLYEFRKAFSDANAKYKKWKKIAIENNVTDLDKEMDIEFPPVVVGWGLGSRFNYNFEYSIKPSVKFTRSSMKLCFIQGETVQNHNYSSTIRPYFVFGSEEESDAFEKMISEKLFKKAGKNDERINELFK